MQALSELPENEKDGMFHFSAYMDYQKFLQEWGLEEYPVPYEQIEDARYIEYGHFERES